MKTGMSLNEMAAEITKQAAAKKDFLVPTQKMAMSVEQDGESKRVALDLGTGESAMGSFPLTEIAHNQLGSHVGIPAKYYDRMLSDSPELLAANVNHWLASEKSTQMVRTMNGRARAILSNRYRAIDNDMVAQAVLPTLLERGSELGLRIESADVSEKRLYIKAVSERITGTVVGQAVQAGIVISNSEIGLHSFKVEEFMLILSCLNGAIRPDSAMKKYHVGRASAELEHAFEVFSNSTRKADDKALMMKMADVVKASFDGKRFNDYLRGVSLTADRKIKITPQAIVEKIVEANGLREDYTTGILASLLKSDDLSQWGVSNAVTEFCQTVDSYEESTQMERIGGAILELSNDQWRELAAA